MNIRDIGELDALAHEVSVCVTKSENYLDTARQKIATVATALDDGEFGKWNLAQWLLIKCRVQPDQVPVLLPKPRELAEAAVQAHPEMSNRALAEKAGISLDTVNRARNSDERFRSTGPRTGTDGKQYANTPKPKAPRDPLQVDRLDTIKSVWRKLNKGEQEAFMVWAAAEGGY